MGIIGEIVGIIGEIVGIQFSASQVPVSQYISSACFSVHLKCLFLSTS